MSRIDNPSMPVPALARSLRGALGCLYSLPTNDDHDDNVPLFGSTKEAHDFLIEFQSRNVRRTIHSKVTALQRQGAQSTSRWRTHLRYVRDRIGTCDDYHAIQQDEQEEASFSTDDKAGTTNGSTWLACLAILCSSDTHYEERLFASQTILHRLRRMKLVEAIDVEVEETSTMQHLSTLFTTASTYSFLTDNNATAAATIDNHVKYNAGKRYNAILTLSALAFIAAHNNVLPLLVQHQHTNTCISRPLLASLGSAISVTALRLQYHAPSSSLSAPAPASSQPTSVTTDTKLNPELASLSSETLPAETAKQHANTFVTTTTTTPTSTTPLLTIVARSISLVASEAQKLLLSQCQNDNIDNNTRAIAETTVAANLSLCTTLAAIPDAILGSINGGGRGGVHGTFSIDPKCIRWAFMELCTPSTGMQLLLHYLTSIPTTLFSSHHHHGDDVDYGGDGNKSQHDLPSHDDNDNNNNDIIIEQLFHEQLLTTCERWVTYITPPLEFLHYTIPLASRYVASAAERIMMKRQRQAQQQQHHHHQDQEQQHHTLTNAEQSAFAYLTSIYDDSIMMGTLIDSHRSAAATSALCDSGMGNTDANYPQRAMFRINKKVKKKKKKKGGSKSKISTTNNGNDDDNDNDDNVGVMEEINKERTRRGEAAYQTTLLIWDRGLRDAALAVLLTTTTTTTISGQQQGGGGDGCDTSDDGGDVIVRCFCACATACLPHLVECSRTDSSIRQQQGRRHEQKEDEEKEKQTRANENIQLFLSLSEVLRLVCSNPNRKSRALSYESLLALHKTLSLSPKKIGDGEQSMGEGKFDIHPTTLENAAIDCIHQCVMQLAISCGYPQEYFSHLSANNDEESEIERNDVRDVIRTVTGAEVKNKRQGEDDRLMYDAGASCFASTRILEKLVDDIYSAVALPERGSPKCLPPETAVHALSALAKPLNSTGTLIFNGALERSKVVTLKKALEALGHVCTQLISSFPTSSLSDILPISRLASIATASLSPLFGSIASLLEEGQNVFDIDLHAIFQHVLRLSVHAAALSLVRIPELAGESSLGDTVFDIRGAMRCPGGEDHVGCLALMRLAFENDSLARAMLVPTKGDGTDSIVLELCNLHDELKRAELARGPGVFHGRGVTPKSRRILLNIISHLGLIAMEQKNTYKSHPTTSGSLEGAISARLLELFHAPISVINESRTLSSITEAERIYRMCEATFDMASFASDLTSRLFSPVDANDEFGETRLECIRSIVDAGVSGYRRNATTSGIPDASFGQWGRLRGALLALFRSCSNPGLPPLAVEAIVALNIAECEAIVSQCEAGPESGSMIFHSSVMGDDVVPAGAFVIILHEIIDAVSSEANRLKEDFNAEQEARMFGECIRALHESRGTVFSAITHLSPEPVSHIDPRPALAEAWYLALNSLALVCRKSQCAAALREDSLVQELISESCSVAIFLLLSPRLEKEKWQSDIRQVGMTVNGPHTLAIIHFLESSFLLGPGVLLMSGSLLQSQLELELDESLANGRDERRLAGSAAIGAALFRAASGGLPPWAVQGVPKLYSAMFVACDNNCDDFCQLLSASAEVRLAKAAEGYGGVRPGEKLAGRFFQNMTEATKEQFLGKVRETCLNNNADGWRRFKVLLKQVCGGKKKASGFNSKPTMTCWDCERI